MAKQQLKWIVTGNFTASGAVAYVKSDGSYSRNLAEAHVFETKEEAEEARIRAAAAEAVVSEPYLTEVAGAAGSALDALTAKERIRSAGPTVPYGPRGQQKSQVV
jgi:hypothetical protein